MPNNYVVISNTGAIGGGKKLNVKGGTWHPQKPAPDSGVGAGGDGWRSIGAAGSKWTWAFTAQFQKVGATGFASFSDVETWATTMTQAQTLLKFQDVYGTVWDVLWVSPWIWDALDNETMGNDAWYTVEVRLQQQ